MYVSSIIPAQSISPVVAATKIQQRHLSKGANLFFECDHVSRIFRVATGVLRLSRVLSDGRRQIVAFGFPGDFIGFPSDGSYTTDCDALTPATLECFPVSVLHPSSKDTALQVEILGAAVAEISAMQEHFLMLGRKTAMERVAGFLTSLHHRTAEQIGQYTQFVLPMTRSDIADFLGLTIETTSRMISKLRGEKVIALDGAQTVIVLDDLALQGRTGD